MRGAAPSSAVRGWAILLALVAAAAVATVLIAAPSGRVLDPLAAQPVGARALAQLLTDRGVRVTVSADPVAAAGGTTLVPDPAALSGAQLGRLIPDAATGTVILIAPSGSDLAAANAPMRLTGQAPIGTVQPACPLPAAQAAGDVRLGGLLYAGPGPSCYPQGGGHALVSLRIGAASLVVVGSPDPLTNAHLGERGNAALALGLLDQHPEVRVLLPAPGAAAAARRGSSLSALFPHRVTLALGELVFVVVLLALARGRRLGPPVAEPLPVTVPAIETALGRGRLWRAARARGAAADSLRSGTRSRLTTRLGVGPGAGPAGGASGNGPPDRSTLLQRVAAASGRPADEVGLLLYGPDGSGTPPGAVPAPLTDASLVRLAADLFALDRQVRIP